MPADYSVLGFDDLFLHPRMLAMKKDEVKIGGVYEVRLHGSFTKVRIEEAFETRNCASTVKRRTTTRWSAINLRTGRMVQIKSAAKLRKEIIAKPLANNTNVN